MEEYAIRRIEIGGQLLVAVNGFRMRLATRAWLPGPLGNNTMRSCQIEHNLDYSTNLNPFLLFYDMFVLSSF